MDKDLNPARRRSRGPRARGRSGRENRRTHGIVAGALALLALTAVMPTAASAACADDAVPVGDVCIDKYEASVWSTPPGVLPETQYGTDTSDYPCATNGQDCAGLIFARSQSGARPAIEITWFQALAACANVGKRLPTNAEWQMAVSGTPNNGAAEDRATDCNTNGAIPSEPTGSRSNCVSAFGAYDMVGNVWEWVADWVPLSAEPCPGWAGFSDDHMCLAGARTDGRGPGPLFRGGGFNDGDAAGEFSVVSLLVPQQTGLIGFRCAR